MARLGHLRSIGMQRYSMVNCIGLLHTDRRLILMLWIRCSTTGTTCLDSVPTDCTTLSFVLSLPRPILIVNFCNFSPHLHCSLLSSLAIIMPGRGRPVRRYAKRTEDDGSTSSHSDSPERALQPDFSPSPSPASHPQIDAQASKAKAARLAFLVNNEPMPYSSDEEESPLAPNKMRKIQRTCSEGWTQEARIRTNEVWHWFTETVTFLRREPVLIYKANGEMLDRKPTTAALTTLRTPTSASHTQVILATAHATREPARFSSSGTP